MKMTDLLNKYTNTGGNQLWERKTKTSKWTTENLCSSL